LELEKQLEELAEKRKRKMSELPGEPQAGSDVITLAIRLATGSRLTRRFSKDTKVQTVYDFVYSQEDLGLENHLSTIQLLGSYPPRPLTDMEACIGDEFEGSSQELLNVKEIEPDL